MTENISAACHACGRSTLQRLNLRPGPDQAYRHDLERSRQRAADLEPIIADLREGGARSLRKLAAALNERGVPAAY